MYTTGYMRDNVFQPSFAPMAPGAQLMAMPGQQAPFSAPFPSNLLYSNSTAPVPGLNTMISAEQKNQFGVGILFQERLDTNNPRYGFYEISVRGIYEGSPADRSKIKEGDILIEINGENVKGLSIRQAAPLIIGPLNTPVQLGFKRAGKVSETGIKAADEIFAVDLVRSTLNTMAAPTDESALRNDKPVPPPAPLPDPADTNPLLKYNVVASMLQGENSYAIARVTTGSSAHEAGLQPNFSVLSIDGKSTKTLSLMEVKVLLLGKEDEKRTIEYLDKSTGQTDACELELDCQAEFADGSGFSFTGGPASMIPVGPIAPMFGTPAMQSMPIPFSTALPMASQPWMPVSNQQFLPSTGMAMPQYQGFAAGAFMQTLPMQAFAGAPMQTIPAISTLPMTMQNNLEGYF